MGDTDPVRVFLVAAHEDAPLARRIRTVLERHGLDVWMPDAVAAGTSFGRAVDEAIRSADAVLVLATPTSSRSAWVSAEVAVASAARLRDPRKIVVPVVVDDGRSIPPLLADTQALFLGRDFLAGDDGASGLGTFAEHLRRGDVRPVPRTADTVRDATEMAARRAAEQIRLVETARVLAVTELLAARTWALLAFGVATVAVVAVAVAVAAPHAVTKAIAAVVSAMIGFISGAFTRRVGRRDDQP